MITLKALDAIRDEAGPNNVAITLAFVGTQPRELSDQYDLFMDQRSARGRADTSP